MAKLKQKAFIDTASCVACGCCTKVCPMNAINMRSGVFADVDHDKCVGCGKCAKECPASVIDIMEVAV